MPPAIAARPAMIQITLRFEGRVTVAPVFCHWPRRRQPLLPSIFFAFRLSHLFHVRIADLPLPGTRSYLMVVQRDEWSLSLHGCEAERRGGARWRSLAPARTSCSPRR